jgi:hypothetical protein
MRSKGSPRALIPNTDLPPCVGKYSIGDLSDASMSLSISGNPAGLPTRNARRRAIKAHGIQRGQIVLWGEHTNESGLVTAIRDDGFYARFRSLYPSVPGGRKPVYMSRFFRFSDLGQTVKIASE